MLTKEELAARLNNRQYGNEISAEEQRLAKEAGLLVFFGASDDLLECRGKVEEEYGCYHNGSYWVNSEGIIDIPGEDAEVLRRYGFLDQLYQGARKLLVNWDTNGWAWSYETDIPHATFEIYAEGEPYCRGIVIDTNNLGPSQGFVGEF